MKKIARIIAMTVIILFYINYTATHETKIPLHFRTYLTPSIPKEFYELIVDYLNKTTNLDVILSVDCEHSGPPQNLADPFAQETIDMAHMCSPAFIWLTERIPCTIELLPIVPLFFDERTQNTPYYFSDVIVSQASAISTFDELAQKSWCFNDYESLSGYFCMLQKLACMNKTTDFFSTLYQSGSHLNSIRLIIDGIIDGSAIDSNVLTLQFKQHPELHNKIRIIESWGPFPIQPLVVHKNLSPEIKKTIIHALQQMAIDKKEALAHYCVKGFGEISDADFNDERYLLKQYELINTITKK